MPRGNSYGVPDDEQREKFLSLIADGRTRQEAAEEVGSSSSRFKALYKRDEVFAERYLEALRVAGKEPSALELDIEKQEGVHLAHRLLDEAIMRALNSERGHSGASNRMLHNLLLLKTEDFKPLLEARVKHVHDGAIGIYAMPQIDTDKWTLAEHEEFLALEDRRNALIAKAAPDTVGASFHQKELVAARVRDADTVDGEAVEIIG